MEFRRIFDTIPEQFDRYRPRYSRELFDYLIGYAKIGPEKTVLEIGPGTGQATDPVLEKELGLDYDYFEVSSPGLTRPLETTADYLRYMGETLDVSLYAPVDGIKEFSCVCESAEDDKVKLKASDGREYELALSDIAKAVRHIDF